MPKQRYFGLLVDRGDDTSTPKWWGFGKEIYQTLLEALLNPQYENFMDPYDGLDADVSIVTKAGNKSEYNAPKLVFHRKESKLAKDQDTYQHIMNSVTPLSDIFKPMSSADMQAALQSWLDMDETDGGEVVKGGETKAAPVEASEDTPLQDLDQAFRKALED